MEAKKTNTFLVPTDFSEVCANAAMRAAAVAKDMGYSLTLLHVIDNNTRAEMKKAGKGQEWFEQKLQDLAAMLHKEYGIKASVMAREGDIFSTIAEVAQDIHASLIFLGTHGKVGMQKVTGSFALKVILSSDIPTIVVQKRKFEKGFAKIVLPITSDSGPWIKTKWAAGIAKEYGAEICIIHLPDDDLEDIITMTTNHFKVNDVKYSLKAAKKSGNFTKQSIDYAAEINADMILIMTNPDKNFKKFILGSYDEEIIFNTAQIPVMCINPRQLNWKKIIAR
jgi:nucleotide-binding universal stress UspA family protein